MNDMDDIQKQTAETVQENIFETLKRQRESRGLSVRDVFAATRISIATLTALEQGDFKNLPPPIYVKSFIRKYAQAIGSDERPLLDAYEAYLAEASQPEKITEVQRPWPEENRRYWVLYGSLAAAIAIGLIVLAIFLYHYKEEPNPSSLPPVSKNSVSAAADIKPKPPVVSSPSKTAAPPTAQNVDQTTPNKKADARYRLVIVARELTWIRILKDGKDTSEMLLRPGEKIEREAFDSFMLDIGNAGGIDISFQGSSLGNLGKHGEVIHLRLPKEEQG